MVTNAFLGKSVPPSDSELSAELGAAKAVWDRLLAELAEEFGLIAQEWTSYSRKAGWSLRLKKRERNIIYLSPGHGGFMASFALSDGAVRAARESKLPKAVMRNIGAARRYAEGTAVRLDISGLKEIPAIKKLASIKLTH